MRLFFFFLCEARGFACGGTGFGSGEGVAFVGCGEGTLRGVEGFCCGAFGRWRGGRVFGQAFGLFPLSAPQLFESPTPFSLCEL